MNMGGGGEWKVHSICTAAISGPQMIYYPTATDLIQAQIYSLVKNWNGMYNGLNLGE